MHIDFHDVDDTYRRITRNETQLVKFKQLFNVPASSRLSQFTLSQRGRQLARGSRPLPIQHQSMTSAGCGKVPTRLSD